MDNTRLYRLAEELAGEFMGEFQEINHYLFEHPELGMVEYESSEYLASYMAGKGFRVEKPVCGMETAFLAVYGESGPQIDLLCEYDALPGYGPEKKPAHACGHGVPHRRPGAGSTRQQALIICRDRNTADRSQYRAGGPA